MLKDKEKEVNRIMYLTIKQQPRLTKEELLILKELSHTAKNLYNEALYNIRQNFFDNGSYLNYYDNYKKLKYSDNYRTINSNMSQQILREVDGCFRSFFALLKKKNEGKYNEKIKIPHYLDKDGYLTLVISMVRISDGNKLIIPYSSSYKKQHKSITVTIPPQLKDKHIKEIRIVPRLKASYFEIQYTYEANITERVNNLSSHKYISLDIGINNLVSAVTSNGRSFIIDGRYLKSVNQLFNKKNSNLLSIHYKQLKVNQNTKYKIPYTNRQNSLLDKRNKRINDYLSKAARYIINYCIDNEIGNIVLGYNKDFQRKSKLSKQFNQNFTNVPIGKLKDKLTYLSELYGIKLIIQEESYTSKASFLDEDEIPEYKANDSSRYCFSGSRIKRGLYKTSKGALINADINGALNILKKALLNKENSSKITSKADDYKIILSNLCIEGRVDVPERIRLA